MAGQILTQAAFNKLGRGILDGNTYQISRLFAYKGPD